MHLLVMGRALFITRRHEWAGKYLARFKTHEALLREKHLVDA